MSDPTLPQLPDPRFVDDAPGLVAALRELRTWAGEPSPERLTRLAGRRRLPDGRIVDSLPGTTLVDTVEGRRLPRPPSRPFVTAFVTACLRARECPDVQIASDVVAWRQALERVVAQEPVPSAMATAEPPVAPVDVTAPSDTDALPPVAARPEEAPGVAAATRVSRRTKVLSAVAALVVAVAVVGAVLVGGDDASRSAAPSAGEVSPRGARSPTRASPPAGAPGEPRQSPSPTATAGGTPPVAAPTGASPAAPAAGWYVVEPGHTRHLGYCWGEGRERNGRTTRTLVVQRPCAEAVRTKLVPLGGGRYRLEWHSPQDGVSCVAVDDGNGGTGPGLLLAPRPCDYGGNQFRWEPRPGGHRLRPVHSGLCVGAVGGVGDTGVGAEAMQDRCTGAADQWYILTPRG